MDDFNRISSKIETRKRKLAQSLATIMNTQDSSQGYQALPPLTKQELLQGNDLAEHRLRLKKGLVRLDDESVNPVIDEFLQRIHK
jgi:hypothetical protein